MTDSERKLVAALQEQMVPKMAEYIREVYGFGSLDEAKDTVRRAFSAALK
jgi:hypothetical protein